MDFFLSENHVVKGILKFILSIFIIFSDIEQSTIKFSDFHTFLECEDDLTRLFTSQPIAVVALSTASVCQPRTPSAGAPTLCPPAPRPLAPQQLPLACQAASRLEPGQACQLLGLALHHTGKLVLGAQQHLLAPQKCPFFLFRLTILAALKSSAEAEKVHALTM